MLSGCLYCTVRGVECLTEMSGVKRKRNVVTMEQKLKAIERLEKGESVKAISNELGVGVTTVKDWRRNKKSIQDFCTQIESEKVLSTRCTLKKPTNELVDDALWLWFMQERSLWSKLLNLVS